MVFQSFLLDDQKVDTVDLTWQTGTPQRSFRSELSHRHSMVGILDDTGRSIPTMRCRDSPQWNDYWLMLAPLVWHIHHKPKRICPVMCPATRQTLFSGTNGHHKLSIIISIIHYGHYHPLITHGNPNWWLVKNTLPISSNDLMDFEIYIQYNMLIFMWETQCHNLPFVDGL
jgi:hypothetical protein